MSHRPRHRHRSVPFAVVIGQMDPEAPEPELDVEWIRRRHCGSKIRYGHHSARAVAYRLSLQTGEPHEAYGCIFEPHFHVGHVAGVAWLHQIAAVIRARLAA